MNDNTENKSPLPFMDRLLERLCAPHLLEEIQGDLQELYGKWLARYGRPRAKWMYFLHALKFIRPYSLKIASHNTLPMIRNYLLIALRTISRSKAFAALNILGLSLGLASSLMIFLWVKNEYRTDNFHTNGDRLYRVYARFVNDDGVDGSYNTPALLPEALKEEVPEVELAAGYAKVLRLSQQGDTYETFENGDKVYKMRGSRAGADFFQMFSYPLIYGDPKTCLSAPDGVVISRKMANLFFGSPQNAYGSTIHFSGESYSRELKVTAVFEDLPSYSTAQFDYLANWDYWVQHDDFKISWTHFGTQTYIMLRKGADPAMVAKKLVHFLNKYIEVRQNTNSRIELGMQRFGDQYLYGRFENGVPVGDRVVYPRSMSVVAFFILLIACINFMNLSTVRSLRRAREVGVRKTAGATRRSLIWQFMGETMLITILGAVIALFIAWIAMPPFNTLTGNQIAIPFGSLSFISKFLILIGVVGIASGAYPALYLSGFQPVRALKGKIRFSSRSIGFRKGLVVFQFALSIALIIITLTVTLQTLFIQNKDIGYDRENIIYIRLEGALIKDYKTFKKEAMRTPGIKYVDRSAQTPHSMGLIGPFATWPGMNPEKTVNVIPSSVGYDFVKLMGLKILAGRDFSEDFPADTANFIVTQSAVDQMELKDPVGTTITLFGSRGTIVGVVNNFNVQSLHQQAAPVILDLKEDLNFGTILVRTKKGETREALANLQKLYTQMNPGYAFQYSFLDDQYEELYTSERIMKKLSNIFGGLSIAISCLGLLGLAMFAAEQRVKEMSIRKVLGATVQQVFSLFSLDFIKLIVVSIIIAVPFSWLAMHSWLQTFAYHIDLSWWIFAAGGGTALLLTLVTIGAQAVRTALTNPAKTLRSE